MTRAERDRTVAHGPGHGRLDREAIRRSGAAISTAESWVLWHLAAHGPITATALAERLELDPTVLAERFAALGRRGYVQPDRQGLPDLTPNGRRAVVALARAGQAHRRSSCTTATRAGTVSRSERRTARNVHGSGRSVHSDLPV
jgi:DNA-binding MarR family transcriptional regulator